MADAMAEALRGLVARRQFRRADRAGAQYLDYPGGGCDRATARCGDFPDLDQDRLGHLAVLPGAAGVERCSADPPATPHAASSGGGPAPPAPPPSARRAR